MIKTVEIMNLLRESFSKQKNDMYELSHPVLRKDGEGYRFAMFLRVKNQEDEANKKTRRPVMYCMSDLDNPSKNAKMIQCSKDDFCDEPYDKTYSTELPHGITGVDGIMEQVYGILDVVRSEYIANGMTDKAKEQYEIYLYKLMAVVPADLVVFYRALSDFPLPEKKEAPEEEKKGVPEKRLMQTEGKTTELLNPSQREEFLKKEKPAAPITEEKTPGVPNELEIVKKIDWRPSENLASLQERYFQILLRLSNKIEFLPCDEKGLIRFKYPLYCFKKDETPGVEKWLDMQDKVLSDKMNYGHMKISVQGALYTRCKNRDKCVFGTCPHIVAAYIRYLKLTNPDELKCQRDIYRKQKKIVDSVDEKDLPYVLNPIDGLDPSKLRSAFSSTESGWIGMQKEPDDTYVITWRKRKKPVLASIHIPAQEIMHDPFDPGAMKDVNGVLVADKIGYALLADNLNKRGLLNKFLSEAKPVPKQQTEPEQKQETKQEARQEVKQERKEATVEQKRAVQQQVQEKRKETSGLKKTEQTLYAWNSNIASMNAVCSGGKIKIQIEAKADGPEGNIEDMLKGIIAVLGKGGQNV